MEKKYPEYLIEKTIPLVQERIKKLSDYLPLAGFLFGRPKSYEMDLSGSKELLRKMREELEKVADWKADEIGRSMQELCTSLGLKTGDFFMILRIAVTGKKISPPLNESMEVLGEEEVLSRIMTIK